MVGTKKRRRAAALQNAPRVYSECGVEDRPSPHKAVVLPNSAIFPDKPNPAHSLFVFSFADLTGDGVADFFETGEVPKIGEFPAFPGLHGLHAAFETLRTYIASTHVHDNRGEKDDHLMPFDGDINWTEAVRDLRRGEGQFPTLFEIRDTGPETASLSRLAEVMERMESIPEED